MTKRAMKNFIAAGTISIGAGLYLINASWVASPPSGRPTVIAQRALHQVYEREGVQQR